MKLGTFHREELTVLLDQRIFRILENQGSDDSFPPCLPSFSDSLLNYQFEADNASVTRYRYFIGAVENQEVPTWFTQGRPPKPAKAFELLINELKEQEIKTLTKKLESPDLPAGVKNTYKQGLFFWKEQIDSILKSPVVDVNATDGDEMTGFNTIGSLVDYHKS